MRGRRNRLSDFWPLVDRSGGFFACWPWLGPKRSDGYGAFWCDEIAGHGRHNMAHRVAYYLHHGVWPEPVCMHLCEEDVAPDEYSYRLCCNPAHLSADTPRANAQHAVRNGRLPFQKHPELAQGSKNGRARLTEEALPDIRARIAAGETNASIARSYGVSRTAISRIALGQMWAHVP